MKSQKQYPAKPKQNLYELVTERMIKLLEKGVSPWRRPWTTYGMPKNYASGHVYRGINAFLMNLTPHKTPYFLSFKQAKALGGKVRKGAKSEMIFFFKSYYKNALGQSINAEEFERIGETGKDFYRISFLKYYRVFNIADVEGIDFELPEMTLQAHERIECCEQIVSGYENPPQFISVNPNQPYYSPMSDELNMPEIGQFISAEEYYCTLFHELTHSTGHKSRLNRDGIVKNHQYRTVGYNLEELVAEMGASFLCEQAGIDAPEVTQNSAAYLAGWLTSLKADNQLVFRAAAAAQRAVDHIIQTTNPQ